MKKPYSVLVVDDDKFLLEMYKKKFENVGAKPDVAVGSAEALVKLRAGAAYDILVFDIIMPGMDGLELLETVKKENLSPGAITVMLTNESEPERIEKAKSLGVSGYIVKATSVPSEVAEEIIEIGDTYIK
ncbi:MAG: two component transcriptional regulator, two-component system, OmpR family, response regulator [Parcubacteria group bacterium]|nr:two component transcriptional regulator, two-component system, OmpR family, response regulator [Parcubacteria group bacterium]